MQESCGTGSCSSSSACQWSSGDSQSTLPQAQASELAAEPSDTEHVGILLHRLLDCLYKHMPGLNGSIRNPTLPQAQASKSWQKIRLPPLTTARARSCGMVLAQVAVHAWNRCADSQSTLPQAQAAELAEDPFLTLSMEIVLAASVL